MKGALGSSLLLYIVLFFIGIIIVFFCGIMAYSKAYKVKNRIVEIIENSNNLTFAATSSHNINNTIVNEIGSFLQYGSYNNLCNSRSITNHLNDIGYTGTYRNLGNENAGYCIYEVTANGSKLSASGIYNNQKYYIVVTFVHFDIPVIGDALNIPVYGSTKVLERTYNY